MTYEARWIYACRWQMASILLLFTWLWTPTYQIWLLLDHKVFQGGQALMLHWDLAAWACAWLNTKWANWLMDACILLALIPWFRQIQTRSDLARSMALILFYVGVWFLTFQWINRWLCVEQLCLSRHSPSLVEPLFIDLSSYFPSMKIKCTSTSSFPGDHGMQLILMGLFFYHYARRWSAGILAVAFFFSLPRILGGVHWLTDACVGGAVIAMTAHAWCFVSPLSDRMLFPLIRACRWLLRAPPQESKDQKSSYHKKGKDQNAPI